MHPYFFLAHSQSTYRLQTMLLPRYIFHLSIFLHLIATPISPLNCDENLLTAPAFTLALTAPFSTEVSESPFYSRSCHFLLNTLQWLPTAFRVKSKIFPCAYKALYGSSSASCPPPLGASSVSLLLVPQSVKSFSRLFPFALDAPLHHSLCLAESYSAPLASHFLREVCDPPV